MVDLSVEGYRVSTLLGASVMLSLAAWLFALSPGSRVHRAFALFFGLRGALSVLLVVNDRVESPAGWTIGYVTIALPFAALHLANQAYVGRGGASPRSWLRSPLVSWGLLAAALAMELAFFVDHDLYVRRGPGGLETGPLGYGFEATNAGYGLLAFVFAYAWTRAPPDDALRRRALFDLSLGFALYAAYSAAFFVNAAVGGWRQLGPTAALTTLGFHGLALAFVLASLAFFLAGSAAGSRTRGDAWRWATGVGLALLTGVLVYVILRTQPAAWRIAGAPAWLYFFTGLGAFWHVVLAGLVAFAIVRCRFLELDVRVRWTLSRSVVASAVVAVFFVFSEAAAEFLGGFFSESEAFEELGSYLGIAAVGLLLFMLSPLHRFGERVAQAAMPDAVPLGQRSARERLALYAEQVRIAWEDGALSAKERRLLDHVRDRLGVTDEQAARLERTVLAELFPGERGRSHGLGPKARLRH